MRSMREGSSLLGAALAALTALSLAAPVALAQEGSEPPICPDEGASLGAVRVTGSFLVFDGGDVVGFRQLGPVVMIEIADVGADYDGDLDGNSVSQVSITMVPAEGPPSRPPGLSGNQIVVGQGIFENATIAGLGSGRVILDFENFNNRTQARITGEDGLEGVHGTGCIESTSPTTADYVFYVHESAGN